MEQVPLEIRGLGVIVRHIFGAMTPFIGNGFGQLVVRRTDYSVNERILRQFCETVLLMVESIPMA